MVPRIVAEKMRKNNVGSDIYKYHVKVLDRLTFHNVRLFCFETFGLSTDLGFVQYLQEVPRWCWLHDSTPTEIRMRLYFNRDEDFVWLRTRFGV